MASSKTTQSKIEAIRQMFSSKRWFIVFTIFSYIFFTVFYMGPSITRCTDTLYGFGDNTAGPIWSYKATDGSFIPSNTNITNYPEGENLSSAVSITSVGQRILYWPLAKLAGPVCGYNLLNVAGFVSTALIMFGFIYWLIRNKWIAWLAGYAVAFVPYMQLKAGSHLSYGFSGILVGIFWLLLSIIKKPTKHKAVTLGLLVSFCIYFDPYFVLYGSLTVLAVAIACLALLAKYCISRKNKQAIETDKIKKLLKSLLLSSLVAVLLLAPFATITLLSRNDIQQRIAAVRGNVLLETRACSNYPHEYLLPFVLHPVPRILKIESAYKNLEIKLKKNFSCGIAEDTVGVSLTLLSMVSLTGVLLIWEKFNRRKIPKPDTRFSNLGHLAIWSAVSLLIMGIMFGLPPTKIFGIPTPIQLVLDITTAWRTIARVFMLVNIALVTFASASLYYFVCNRNISKAVKRAGYIIVVLAVFLEYQAFPLFKGNTMSTFSYSRNAPAVYNWLKSRSDIKTIAEYPMESYGESDAPSYYLSMQSIHNKQILNSPSPNSSLEVFRRSIKNINDPQSLPALRALGIDAVIIHGVGQDFIDNHMLIDSSDVFAQPQFSLEPHSGVMEGDKSVVLSTGRVPGVNRAALIGLLTSGFYRNLGIIDYPKSWAYEAVEGAKINLMVVSNGKIKSNPMKQDYCFDIRASALGEVIEFQPQVDGKTSYNRTITSQYVSVRLSAKDTIVLNNNRGSNMQIQNLGCNK